MPPKGAAGKKKTKSVRGSVSVHASAAATSAPAKSRAGVAQPDRPQTAVDARRAQRPMTPPPPPASVVVPSLEGTPSARTRNKVRQYEKAVLHLAALAAANNAASTGSASPAAEVVMAADPSSGMTHTPTAQPALARNLTAAADHQHHLEPQHRAARRTATSNGGDVTLAVGSTSTKLDVVSLDGERTRLALKCQSLMLACRTQLAQYGDVSGVLALRHGVLCDDRVLESASRLAGFSISFGCVAQLSRIFPEFLVADWQAPKQSILLPQTCKPLLAQFGAQPKVRFTTESIPDVADLRAALSARYPSDASLGEVLAAPAAHLTADENAAPEEKPPPLGEGIPSHRTCSRAPPLPRSAASPLKTAAPLRALSGATIPTKEAAGDEDAVLPGQLAAFLSPGKLAAVRDYTAYRHNADHTNAVGKSAERCALDLVVPAYDRIRSHMGAQLSSVGTRRAIDLLKHLSSDLRPVDQEAATARLQLLLSFSGPAGIVLRGSIDEGVIMFNRAGANRAGLNAAVVVAAAALTIH